MPFPDVNLLQFTPAVVLVFFRVAGIFLIAPLFGSARVPKRIKLMMALVMAAGLSSYDFSVVSLPTDLVSLTVAIVGELLFGLAMGLVLTLVFVGAQWAGDMIGHQLGFNLSESLDPQFSGAGTVMSEVYFLLCMLLFLILGGHREMIIGMHDSLTLLPPGSLTLTPELFDLLVGLFNSATVMAIRMAAPIFLTMLILDVALGAISKTMPQLNVMTAGMSMRSALGLLILVIGAGSTAAVLGTSLEESFETVRSAWTGSY